jgi:uncharacterized membrane protein
VGVGFIRRYGAKEPTVIQALLRLAATVLAASGNDPAAARAIAAQAGTVKVAAHRHRRPPAHRLKRLHW